MVPLIMEWIEKERTHEVKWFNLGDLWMDGEPDSWKGFSFFKKKFNPTIFELPPIHRKIIFPWSKRWQRSK